MDKPLLYSSTQSFGSQLARMVLCEKGIEFKVKNLDTLASPEHLESWYGSVTTELDVPAMVIGKETLFGGHDIAWYSERQMAGKRLLPRDKQQEELVYQWVDKISKFPIRSFSYGNWPGIPGLVARHTLRRQARIVRRRARHTDDPDMQLAYHNKAGQLQKVVHMVGDRSRLHRMYEELGNLLDEMEQCLQQQDWLAVEFSLADIFAAVFLARLELIGFKSEWRRDYRPALHDYYLRLQKLKSFKKAKVCRTLPKWYLTKMYIRANAWLILIILGGSAAAYWYFLLRQG